MRPTHIILGILLAIIWGCNFIAIQLSLTEIPPFLLCAIRFFFASVPIIFFIKRPAIPLYMLTAYGLLTFGIQFTLLFVGMNLGMPPGLSSLILQMQLFFSLLLAIIFTNERPNRVQIIGMCVAFGCIAVVISQLDHTASIFAFSCVLLAALSWGAGNIITKKFTKVNAIALVTWGSFVACLPLAILSLLIDGPSAIINSIKHLSLLVVSSTAYIVYLSTWVGYGLWNWLLKKYNIATVVPFGLLVPVFGMLSSTLIFNEEIQLWKLTAACLILLGVSIHLFGAHFSLFLTRAFEPLVRRFNINISTRSNT